ncbi:MAG: DUF1858 domain-containing protein [Candidatus Paceibacterota bacterium]
MSFDEDTTLEELLEDEEAKEVLEKYELPCLGCPMAQFEMQDLTLKDMCNRYNLDVDKILEELNE